MTAVKSILLLALFINTQLWASVIRAGAQYFKQTGSVDQFSWAPERYRDDFKYDVLYFVPESIKDASKVPAIIFMHGGGTSTLSREGSLKTASAYMKGLGQSLANDLMSIVVIPSASGLNWGGHTYMLRDLAALMRTELEIDPNQIGLSGHSMGGMGITRSYPLLADQFAYMIPMASGMDIAIQDEHQLNKVFNVPYVHLQGLKDHFTIFIERCNEQLTRIKALEEQYGMKSKFELIYYDGAHNYDYPLTLATFRRLQRQPRDLYQKTLYGTILTANSFLTYNNIPFHLGSVPGYFWVRALKADLTEPEKSSFIATITDNVINIEFTKSPKSLQKLRIYLSQKLVNLHFPVTIKVNGIIRKRHYTFVEKQNLNPDPTDSGFIFEDYVDVSL